MKKILPTVLITLVFFIGVAAFLYPTVANYLYEKNSSKLIVDHAEKLEQIDPELLAAEKEAVARYNQSLFENAVVLTDPFDPDAFPITDGEYTQLLAVDDVMAYLEIPAIDVYLPIYHGTSEEALRTGVGHLENTSLPMGGETTHTVLSGHCGLPSARLFTDLHLLQEGNIFHVYVLDEVLTYQVYKIEIVEPENRSSLYIEEGKGLVTLITCTPYGKNTHRLLVHGKRIEVSAQSPIEEPEIEQEKTWEDYTVPVAIGVTILFLLLLVSNVILSIRRRKRAK